MFRSTVRAFVDREVAPRAEQLDVEAVFPTDLFERMGELGFYGLRYPESLGGLDLEFTSYCILTEELARGSLGVATICAMQCLMGTDFLFRFGSPELHEQYLRPAIAGRKLGTFALTEPNAGSDLGGVSATAVRDGDDWVINGQKMWITSATHADFFTVGAKTDPEAGIKGISFFLVDKQHDGLSVGKKIEKCGVRCSETTELSLDGVRVPASHMLGEPGQATKQIFGILAQIRIMTGALAVGLMRAVKAHAAKYANERSAFGRPIAKFQAIQAHLAEIETKLVASHLLTYQAAARVDRGEDPAHDGAIAKYFASEAAVEAADRHTRILGGYGIAREYPAERYFRDARFLLFGGGTSEILRGVIARKVSEEA
jgi:alkylation response protein AidB-like acyl-CoA dehydrogenase